MNKMYQYVSIKGFSVLEIIFYNPIKLSFCVFWDFDFSYWKYNYKKLKMSVIDQNVERPKIITY